MTKKYIPFREKFKKCRENGIAYDVVISARIPFLTNNKKTIENASKEFKVIICDKYKAECNSRLCKDAT